MACFSRGYEQRAFGESLEPGVQLVLRNQRERGKAKAGIAASRSAFEASPAQPRFGVGGCALRDGEVDFRKFAVNSEDAGAARADAADRGPATELRQRLVRGGEREGDLAGDRNVRVKGQQFRRVGVEISGSQLG